MTNQGLKVTRYKDRVFSKDTLVLGVKSDGNVWLESRDDITKEYVIIALSNNNRKRLINALLKGDSVEGVKV